MIKKCCRKDCEYFDVDRTNNCDNWINGRERKCINFLDSNDCESKNNKLKISEEEIEKYCIELYMNIHVSQLRNETEFIQKMWKIGQELCNGKLPEEIVYLPVNKKTGEVDYEYVTYRLSRIEDCFGENFKLIGGWEYKPFKIIPFKEKE